MRRLLVAAALTGLLAGCAPSRSHPADGARSTPTAVDDTSTGQLPSSRARAAATLAPCPAGSVGSRAPAGLPAVTLACLGAGPAVALGALRGPAVVNLWASWCESCREEMPRLQALHARAGARLLVLGLVTDDERDRALAAAAAFGVHYPSVLDRGGSVRRSYGFLGPPVTLLVDRRGTVVHRIVGAVPATPELLAIVSRYLGVRA